MIHTLFEFWERVTLEAKGQFVKQPYMATLCRCLELCVFGGLPNGAKNLAISIPPRHYKTRIASQILPIWCWAEAAPDCEFITTSSTDALVVSNAIASRKLLAEKWLQDQYPHLRISKTETDSQHYFNTTAGGHLYASGLGGQITGFGAGKVRNGFGGAIIIDDPLKAIEAHSQTMREKVIQYYTGTLKSRRNRVENTPIILIMQRLHVDDLVGWIMKNEPGQWHLVSFPAINDKGELLNPITTSLKELKTLKEVDPGTYYAQYQQTPMIDGGNIIKMAWWKFYNKADRIKPGLRFITADTAFKEAAVNDVSVLRVWEGNYDGLYCLDAVYGRWEFPRLLQEAKDYWEKWLTMGVREFYIEDKASGTPLVQSLVNAGVPAMPWAPADYDFPDNKVARMRASSAAVHGGKVLLPLAEVPTTENKLIIDDNREVYPELHAKVLIEEAAAFAADMSHTHDDHCDTLTMAVSIWQDNL